MEEGNAEGEILREFEIFKEAIRDENLEVQIEITKHLGALAEHLGEELTRRELLPFIRENIDFHDEILLNLSEQLKQFIPLVGGYEHSQPILELLAKLCNTDETIVRSRTVETLRNIARHLDGDQTERLFMPIVEKLAAGDWFTSKSSAAALHAAIYSKVSEEKQAILRNSYRTLVQDESPIVRKDATINLIDLIPLLDREHIINEFIPVFDNLAKDPMDSVRVFAVDVAVALAKRLTEAEVEQFLLKTIEDWGDEPSWRIRQNLAQNIAELLRVVPYNKSRGRLLAVYQKLLRDVEAEVRVTAARNAFLFCGHLKRSYDDPRLADNFEPVLLQSVLPHVNLIVSDPSEEVRLAISSNVLSIGSLVGRDFFGEHVLPLVVEILENEPSMSIQENVLHNLNMLPGDVDLTRSLRSIRNVVRSLIINSQSHWRTRRSLLVAFMHIAKFADGEFFADNLKIYYAALLGDPIFSVRRTAAVLLPLLARRYGMEWAFEHLLPFFVMFTKDSRYLYKYVPLYGLQELIAPSVDGRNPARRLLRDFRAFLTNPDTDDGKRAARELSKIDDIADRLAARLGDRTCSDILSLSSSIDDFSADTISSYAEDTLDVLRLTCRGDVFSVDEEALALDAPTYLRGLLSLIHREYLRVVLELFDDRVVNVQVRSIHALDGVKGFVDGLRAELGERWAREAIDGLDEEERRELRRQVDEELSRRIIRDEEEALDTELAESDKKENVVPNGGVKEEIGSTAVEGEIGNTVKEREEKICSTIMEGDENVASAVLKGEDELRD